VATVSSPSSTATTSWRKRAERLGAPQAPTREGAAKRAFALVMLLAAALGCSTGGLRPGLRGENAPRLRDASYRKALDRATRFESCYDGLDARAYFAITFESDAFRKARVIATARMLGMSRGDEEALLADELEAGAESLEFLVSLYTPTLAWNDMTSDRSIWAIEIPRVGEPPTPPSSIERIPRPDANMQALYPHASPFGATYRVRFPRVDAMGRPVPGPATPRLVLQIASALCTIDPSWESLER